MINCFFVHTQLQLLVSQMIISQKKLSNNILILSVSSDNVHACSCYNKILQNDHWSSVHYIEDYQYFVSSNFFKLKNIRLIQNRFEMIDKLLKNKNVTDVYFGDQNNITIRFLILKLKKCLYNIHLYEEGTSHYKIVNYTQQYSYLGYLYLKAMCLYYSIFFGIVMLRIFTSKGIFVPQVITKRYNLLPLNSEVYDERIDWSITSTLDFNDILNSEVLKILSIQKNKELQLYLTQPLTDLSESLKFTGIEIFRSHLLDQENRNLLIVLKFHPRESEVVRTAYFELLKSLEIEYYIISTQFCYPVEFLVNQLSFSLIISIGSSAAFYILYCQKIKSIYLYNELQEYCTTFEINSPKIENYIQGIKVIENKLRRSLD